MNEPLVLALAAAAASVVEALVLSPLSYLRSKAIAGRRGRPSWAYSVRRGWRRGLPLQMATLIARRSLSFGGAAWLTAAGLGGGVAGLVVGALEGVAFAPTRRIAFLQQVRRHQPVRTVARQIVRREGARGLWRGASINALRAGFGGAAYFGFLRAAALSRPDLPAFVPGALAAAASTVAVHPFELALARAYLGKPLLGGKLVSTRGLGLSLLRAVPGATLYYMLLRSLADMLAASTLASG